ncbi:ABC transporter permease [Enterococcus sp. LJL128]
MIKQRVGTSIFGIVSIGLLWQLLAVITGNRAVPTPMQVMKEIWEIKQPLLLHAGASAARISVALLFALIVGLPLGILLSRSRWFGRLFGPILYFLYPLPKVAFLPVFMIFFGLGNLSKVLLIFSIISIQVIVSIRDSVNQIPAGYYQVMENYHSTKLQVFQQLLFPALIPALISSLRVSTGISLAALFFAENYNTTFGLGYLILSAWTKMNYEEMFAGIVMIGLLGFALFSLFDSLERKMCTYK